MIEGHHRDFAVFTRHHVLQQISDLLNFRQYFLYFVVGLDCDHEGNWRNDLVNLDLLSLVIVIQTELHRLQASDVDTILVENCRGAITSSTRDLIVMSPLS